MRGLMYLYEFPMKFRLFTPSVFVTLDRPFGRGDNTSPEDVWYKLTQYRDDVFFTILRAFDTLYFFRPSQTSACATL